MKLTDNPEQLKHCHCTPCYHGYAGLIRCIRKLRRTDFCNAGSWKRNTDRFLLLHAGHTYVILVILSKRKAIMRYRVLRPNNIFQPLVASHMLRSNYKKVCLLCTLLLFLATAPVPKTISGVDMLQC